MHSATQQSKQNAVNVKRKRAATASPPLGKISSNKASLPRSTDTTQKQKQGFLSQRRPPLGSDPHPRLDAIPSRIEDLVKIIDFGGCPRCGGVECTRTGKLYTCEECYRCFYENQPKAKPKSRSRTYVDRTFEGKERLQALFHHAYNKVGEMEMDADALEFDRRMAPLQAQLREKRKNVSRLLGISFGGDDCKNNHDEQQKITEKIVNWNHHRTKYANATARAGENPSRAAILLLRRETSKLERTLTELMGNPFSDPGDISPNYFDKKRKILHEEDKSWSEVDIITVQLSDSGAPGNNDGNYQLASRMIQDEGVEIEIFEKCV